MSSQEQTSRRSASGEGLRLEPAEVCDARALGEMSRLVIEHGLRWRWNSAAIAREIRDPDAIVLVARLGTTRIGFAAMHFDFDRASSHLQLLAVAPNYRRQGIGGALVAWLEKVARRGGASRITLEVRETAAPARHFYAELGFREVERIPGYYDGREAALRLEKQPNRAG